MTATAVPFLEHIRKKSWRYWLMAAVVGYGGHLLFSGLESEVPRFEQWRTQLFQVLGNAAARKPLPRYGVRLVLIGDEEYWQGDLAGRRPIKRKYLAGLVRALDAEMCS